MAVLNADKVIAALRGAFAREAGRAELLRIAAEKIRAAGPPYTSVYLYMLHGDELVLEAFAGRETDHTRIPVGKGVCGTAVATGQDQNVPDVRAVENYIACNTWTRSELVVLIRRGAAILGRSTSTATSPTRSPPTRRRRCGRWRTRSRCCCSPVMDDRLGATEEWCGSAASSCSCAGSAGTPVVVLHGGPGAHHGYLLPEFDALADRRELIYYDQRGGGRSPVPRDVPVGWSEQVADLEALRSAWASSA